MLPEEVTPSNCLDSLHEDFDVDFPSFDFLPSNSRTQYEQAAEPVDILSKTPADVTPSERLDEEVKNANTMLDDPATGLEDDDTLNGLKVDSSDPLLFIDETELPTADVNLTNSSTMPSQELTDSPHTIDPQSSASSIAQAFPDIDAVAVEASSKVGENPTNTEHTRVLRGRQDHFEHTNALQSHEMQFVGRRRSQSVPPTDLSFHRRLDTGDMLHIGSPLPNRHPASTIQRSHPYENARSKRFNDTRYFLHGQRLTQAPQQILCRPAYMEGVLSSPINSILNVAPLDVNLQESASVESIRQHRGIGVDSGRLRHRSNMPLEQSTVRQVALTEAQYLCERMLYRLATITEATRRDAIMLGQDSNLEVYVSLLTGLFFLKCRYRVRGPQRVANASVNSLDQPLKTLTLHSVHNGVEIPGNGRALRSLGGKVVLGDNDTC
jgi:hypothetical protein